MEKIAKYESHDQRYFQRAINILGVVGLSGVVLVGCAENTERSSGEQVVVCAVEGENQGRIVAVDSREASSHSEYHRNLDDCMPSWITSQPMPSSALPHQ